MVSVYLYRQTGGCTVMCVHRRSSPFPVFPTTASAVFFIVRVWKQEEMF